MNDLIDFVSRRAGLTRVQADLAVKAALEYFTAHLPSPVVGRIHEMLANSADGLPGQNSPSPDEES